jgi:hypothetical protein
MIPAPFSSPNVKIQDATQDSSYPAFCTHLFRVLFAAHFCHGLSTHGRRFLQWRKLNPSRRSSPRVDLDVAADSLEKRAKGK